MDSYSTYIAPKSIIDPTLGATGTPQKIKKAAQDFEAMFVSEMIRPIFDMQEQNPDFSGGNSEKIYRSMLVDEYGKNIAKAGGLGIAKHVEAELMKLQEVQHQPNPKTMENGDVAGK